MSFQGHVAEESQRELLAAYALEALDDAEATEVQRHLADCEACRGYLQWLEAAVDLLPRSVEQLRPSPSVRAAILAEVNADAAAATVEGKPSARRASRPGWRGLLLRPVTAFAAAALVVAGIAGYEIGKPDEPMHSTIQAKAAPGVPSNQVSASLQRVDGSGTLVVQRMPPLTHGQVYDVWVQRGAATEYQSSFVPEGSGSTNAAVPGPLDGADAVLVSRENHSGAKAKPSGPVVLRADLG
jgi:anti-sigma-K factor RskA